MYGAEGQKDRRTEGQKDIVTVKPSNRRVILKTPRSYVTDNTRWRGCAGQARFHNDPELLLQASKVPHNSVPAQQ